MLVTHRSSSSVVGLIPAAHRSLSGRLHRYRPDINAEQRGDIDAQRRSLLGLATENDASRVSPTAPR
jgi:hypothetical protein